MQHIHSSYKPCMPGISALILGVPKCCIVTPASNAPTSKKRKHTHITLIAISYFHDFYTLDYN